MKCVFLILFTIRNDRSLKRKTVFAFPVGSYRRLEERYARPA